MKDETNIIIILDKSGSMQPQTNATIEGFNEFLKSQQEVEGDARLTLIQFAEPNAYTTTYDNVPIKSVEKLNNTLYRATGGSTAYLDAVGKTINETGERLKNLPESERPNKNIVVIITDGAENSSREFNKSTIAEMIKHQEDVYKWEFVFLGANMDAVSEGLSLGVTRGKSFTYAFSATGITSAYAATSKNLANYRLGNAVNTDFTQEDRDEQTKAVTK